MYQRYVHQNYSTGNFRDHNITITANMLSLTVRTDAVIIYILGKPIPVLDIVCLVMCINWQQSHSHASPNVTYFSLKLLSDFTVDTLQIIASITSLLTR